LRSPEELKETLSAAETLIEDLLYVKKVICPCFPEHYQVLAKF
jgi:hypothetical protein